MRSFRTIVFLRAAWLRRTYGFTWSEALEIAWRKYRTFRDARVTTLQSLMSEFDTYYEYTDDPRVRRVWEKRRNYILEILEQYPWLRTRLRNNINFKYFVA